MEISSPLSIGDICEELGLEPQFLFNLAEFSSKYYQTFYVPKRSGGFREISASQDKLKRVQRVFVDGLFSRIIMPPHVHGCVRGRSVVTNAGPHTNKDVVVNLDLSNFFGSIKFGRVKEIFESKFNCDATAAEVLAKLCIFNGGLPQGAPTSPTLANIAAFDLDKQIMQLCLEKVGANQYQYTRYVDDITISGTSSIAGLADEIIELIRKNGFEVNAKKTRILRQSTCQKVTGVVVNRKLSPPKKLLRKVRQQLYFCEKFGLDGHCKRQNVAPNIFVKQLRGMISYIRLTRPELADGLVVELGKSLPVWDAMEEEDCIARLLSKIITAGKVASFYYENFRCRVAPTEVTFDADDNIVVRAFQLSPSEGWREFKVALLSSLQIEEEPEETLT